MCSGPLGAFGCSEGPSCCSAAFSATCPFSALCHRFLCIVPPGLPACFRPLGLHVYSACLFGLRVFMCTVHVPGPLCVVGSRERLPRSQWPSVCGRVGCLGRRCRCCCRFPLGSLLASVGRAPVRAYACVGPSVVGLWNSDCIARGAEKKNTLKRNSNASKTS